MADKEIDKVPRITLETEAVASRRGSITAVRDAVDAARIPVPTAQPSSRNLAIALILVATVSLAGLAWLYLQWQQSQQDLHAAVTRIEQLEARLASTDTSMTKSEVLLGAKLKAMDDANSANKIDIHRVSAENDKNSKSIESSAAEIKNLQASVKDMQPQLQQTVTQVTADSTLLKSVDSTAKETAQRMEMTQETLHGLETDTKALKDKQVDTGKRVNTLEDTAKSTDVFRRNTQDELRQLREELSRLLPPVPVTAAKPAN
jgi:chromosome segregation ATPase